MMYVRTYVARSEDVESCAVCTAILKPRGRVSVVGTFGGTMVICLAEMLDFLFAAL